MRHYGGALITVTDTAGAVFTRRGRRLQGVTVNCAAPSRHPGGTARWTLYRRPGELLYKVPRGG